MLHQKTLSLIALLGSLIATPQVSAEMSGTSNVQDTNPVFAGNVLQVRGWYEHYGNGQIVLYPAVTPNPNGMSSDNSSVPSMDNMPSMADIASMADMPSMMGMETIPDVHEGQKIPKVYRMTYGQFWIDKKGNLVLQPIKRMSNMGGSDGMSGVATDFESKQ
ncbi:MAG: hypothetical protein VSS75_016325 [Candidatus Parabeggiatoa sp.]|nr:hypothetical protein [Candidatus Parabeggiatoa sp.]